MEKVGLRESQKVVREVYDLRLTGREFHMVGAAKKIRCDSPIISLFFCIAFDAMIVCSV